MKKLLLAGLLVVSSMALAINPNEEYEEIYKEKNATEEKSIDVKAKVIAPLAIENVKGVDFGVIIKGQKKDSPAKEGGFDVIGEPGQKINIYVAGSDRQFKKETSLVPSHEVKLVKVGGSSSNANEVINATMNVFPQGGDFGTKGSIIIPSKTEGNVKEGVQNFNVSGKIPDIVPTTTVSGDYMGNLYVKAQYE